MVAGKVSIVTPNFNRLNVIEETVNSILNQTYTNWEWVICDDGSTDGCYEYLKTVAEKDSRILLLQRDREPQGAPTCRNIAVENSSGDYLLFLDNDDLLSIKCLEQRVAALESIPDCDCAIFPMLVFKKQIDDLRLYWNCDNDCDDFERILFGDPIFQGSGALWKRSKFIFVGNWKEGLKVWQDVELHLRSYLKGIRFAKFMNFKPDLYIRISEESISRSDYHSHVKLLSRISVFQDIFCLSIKRGYHIKYKAGFRHMSLGLFQNLSDQKIIIPSVNFLYFLFSNRLFSHTEYLRLLAHLFLSISRASKITFVKRKIDYMLRELDSSYTPTLNCIRYDGQLLT